MKSCFMSSSPTFYKYFNFKIWHISLMEFETMFKCSKCSNSSNEFFFHWQKKPIFAANPLNMFCRGMTQHMPLLSLNTTRMDEVLKVCAENVYSIRELKNVCISYWQQASRHCQCPNKTSNCNSASKHGSLGIVRWINNYNASVFCLWHIPIVFNGLFIYSHPQSFQTLALIIKKVFNGSSIDKQWVRLKFINMTKHSVELSIYINYSITLFLI